MATTTNYGWTTPDDTALVKDGASAIRTLGSSVDTSVKSLNPGTTAGDVDYYTAATTKARVAIGTNGQVLTSNGSVPSWQTPSSGGMTLLATTTLSGTSTVLSSINQTYNSLVFIGYGITWSANSQFQLRPNSTNDVSQCLGTMYNSGVGGVFKFARILPYTDETFASNANNSFYLTINNYTSTSYKPFAYYGSHANNLQIANLAGTITSASAITSMQFTTNAGTASFNAGTILTYGVK
jgi:hypothetical protein